MSALDKNGNIINFCHVPRKVKSNTERRIYTALLNSHCSHPCKKTANHKCCGEIKINAKSITMSCVKCGDSKAMIGKDGGSDAA